MKITSLLSLLCLSVTSGFCQAVGKVSVGLRLSPLVSARTLDFQGSTLSAIQMEDLSAVETLRPGGSIEIYLKKYLNPRLEVSLGLGYTDIGFMTRRYQLSASLTTVNTVPQSREKRDVQGIHLLQLPIHFLVGLNRTASIFALIGGSIHMNIYTPFKRQNFVNNDGSKNWRYTA